MKKAMAFALTAVLALGVLGLVGCGSQGGGTQSQDGKPVLTVAMELAYPPFETKDDAGQPAGLAVDFMRDFADRYGYDLVIENTAWDGLIPSLQTDKADGFLYDQLTIYRNNVANPDTTEAIFIPFQEAESWGIAVKKGDTELLDQLNEFIAVSKTDGEFDRLTEKYLADEKRAFDEHGFKWFFDFE